MLPLLNVGPFLLQLPLLALMISLWFGMTLAEKTADQLGLRGGDIYDMVFYALLGGLIGARLGYAAQYLTIYMSSPFDLIAPTPATLAPESGLLAGAVVAVLWGQHKSLPLRPTLDALAPGLAVLMIGLGVAHLLSGDAYGAPADLPWSIFLWGQHRHPSQVYEIMLALGIFVVTIRWPVGAPGQGLHFLRVIALSAAAALFVEAFRGDSMIGPGGIRVAQIIGLLVLMVSLWLMRVWSRLPSPLPGEIV